MQNYGEYSFIQNHRTFNSCSDHIEKEITVGCDTNRLERSPYNFEWKHSITAYISNNTNERYIQA